MLFVYSPVGLHFLCVCCYCGSSRSQWASHLSFTRSVHRRFWVNPFSLAGISDLSNALDWRNSLPVFEQRFTIDILKRHREFIRNGHVQDTFQKPNDVQFHKPYTANLLLSSLKEDLYLLPIMITWWSWPVLAYYIQMKMKLMVRDVKREWVWQRY